jgi:putative transposase
MVVKLVTAVRLFPDAAADAALRDTLALCNQAANLVSAVAFGQGIRSRQALQRKTYRDLKDMGLSAQPFDDRCLSWQLDRRTVSIWTTAGRLAGLRFACSAAQFNMLRDYRQGESDLVHRDGMWFLHTTCEVPETPAAEPGGFLRVDLGIANIATTSDGTRYGGKFLNRVRHRHARLRAKLQSKGTKSAKRLLKKRARKEAGSRPTPITASPSRS